MFTYCYGKPKMYRPYISYTTWKMINGGEVNNEGTFTENLKMYSGNPMDFQGSQDIPDILSLEQSTPSDMAYACGLMINSVTNTYRINEYLGVASNDNRQFLFQIVNGYINFYDGSAWYVINEMLESNKYYVITFNYTHSSGIIEATINGNMHTFNITPYSFNNFSRAIIGSNGSSYRLDGTIDFICKLNRKLTAYEIQQSYTNPNQFYNAIVNDANTLFCTDFRGTDGYIADDKNKSVGSAIIQDSGSKVSVAGDTRIAQVTQGLLFEANKSYHISYEFDYLGSIGNFRAYIPPTCRTSGTAFSRNIPQISNGVVEIIVQIPNDYITTDGNSSFYFWLEVDGTPTTTNFSNISVKEISGVYPITNYSSTMRTNFQTESTGLQELLIERDSLGFFLGLRDYPKGNGVGNGDTSWIPSGIYTIECIISKDIVSVSNTWALGSYTDPSAKLRINFIGESIRLEIGSDAYSYSVAGLGDVLYIAISVDEILGAYTLYINGVLENSRVGVTFDQSIYSLALFARNLNGFNYFSYSELRLFKSHNKVLTQEEITINYNKYVTQGLLS